MYASASSCGQPRSTSLATPPLTMLHQCSTPSVDRTRASSGAVVSPCRHLTSARSATHSSRHVWSGGGPSSSCSDARKPVRAAPRAGSPPSMPSASCAAVTSACACWKEARTWSSAASRCASEKLGASSSIALRSLARSSEFFVSEPIDSAAIPIMFIMFSRLAARSSMILEAARRNLFITGADVVHMSLFNSVLYEEWRLSPSRLLRRPASIGGPLSRELAAAGGVGLGATCFEVPPPILAAYNTWSQRTLIGLLQPAAQALLASWNPTRQVLGVRLALGLGLARRRRPPSPVRRVAK